jgi:amino acid adenylation domain-containing protein
MKLPPEQQAIRAKCFHPTGDFTELQPEEIEQSAPERFEKIVGRYPDRLALKTRTCELSYRQLNAAANRVARAILATRGEKSEPVALMFEQGAPAIIAILAVLKTGKFYVPLDPAVPRSRSQEILADSTASLLVTNTQNLVMAESAVTDEYKVINIDDLGDDLVGENPKIFIPPDALAYIVYTSGSTGEPKGVAQTHRYVLYHVFEYGNSFHLCPDDRVSLVFPWTFNGGIHIIHSTLLNGAALFPFDVKADGLIDLARLLVEEKITIYHSTATILRQMLSLLNRDERLPSLRLVRFGGDTVTEADIELYKNNFSQDCLLINSLATTESGLICRYFFDKDTAVVKNNVPAGYPTYGKEILLLDDSGNAAGFDRIGEIAVKSRYLSSGYWGQPSLTATKFIPDQSRGGESIYLTGDLGRMSSDGCLYHLGRKDFQVKVRGYRVDVGELETALLHHDDVKEVAVVGGKDHLGNSRLVAYFVPAGKIAPSVSALRKFLSEKLPDYMIPASFIPLDSLPLTPNGKINRRLLPAPDRSRPELETPMAAPRNEVEKELAQIWAEVLALDEVGICDNFFDLGGDSLSASRIVSSVLQHFQLEIPLKALFQSPTVAEMAFVIAEHQDKRLNDQDLETLLSELESISDEEAVRLVSENRRGDSKS